MSLTVTQRPNQNTVWVAAKMPVIYKMTRKDFTWTTLVTSAGNTSIQIAGNQTANFVTGDTIWLQSDDGAYSASGTVVSSAFGAATTVITTVPYVANNATGYINLTSRRPNYYVKTDVYKSVDNTLAGSVNYYPTKKGLLTIDVSQPLHNVLDPSIASIPAIASTADKLILQDSNITEGFYIKYTEVWTGSGNSATDDSGNISYAIYGARQLGVNSLGQGNDAYYGDYVNLKALTNLDSLLLAQNEIYSLSYISANGGNNDWIRKKWIGPDGNIICSTYLKSTDATAIFTSVPKSVYTLFQKFSFIESLTPDRNIAVIGTIDWTSNSITLVTGTTSKAWSAILFVAQNKSISLSYDMGLSGNGIPVGINLYLFDSSGTVLINTVLFTQATGNRTGSVTITNSGGADAYFIGFDFANPTGANKTLSINSLSIDVSQSSTVNISKVEFTGLTIASGTPYNETGLLFAAIQGNIMQCTKNPITLMWRNSLGGQSSWVFNFSQDLVYKLQDIFKNGWLTVYDNNVTYAQYNALHDLFTLGQIYQTPIIEFTTSIDKTEARIGQQVYYVYLADNIINKLGVVVIPSENRTITKRNKHLFAATIELPEVFT